MVAYSCNVCYYILQDCMRPKTSVVVVERFFLFQNHIFSTVKVLLKTISVSKLISKVGIILTADIVGMNLWKDLCIFYNWSYDQIFILPDLINN